MASGTDNPHFDWLYPGILTKQQLIDVLNQRYIKEQSLESMSKDELVDLYTKYIIPLPQRKYRQNRRGQEMTKKQILAAKKRRISAPGEHDEPPEKKASGVGLVNSYGLPNSGGDRLKPPPSSCINTEKKTIKLSCGAGSTSKSVPDVAKSLNVLKINKGSGSSTASASSNATASSKATKRVSPEHSDVTKISTVASIHNGLTEDNSKMDTSEHIVEEETPQKKIKKISWP
ncbi:uncharacterized protein LOC127852341 [Dreissena polymorpha]|uniref:Ashwin n=1 Tax=Dreissena polymorpha TaxID=45954 RepID=A0A9D4HRK0_DREPO|nr:uncharacterized protein LOC127852341 [Dreissena polymorpha]KAH3728456.1 hypothetical protein DPMN_054413 [Dreissena polymorpha]